MPVFLVSYDLNVAGRNYDGLVNTIRQLPGYCRVSSLAWLISSEETAAQLFNRLAPMLDQRDRLLVIEVMDHYQGWLTKPQWAWIKRTLG
jgi:hypothetical protein